jgi:hypothetical protein
MEMKGISLSDMGDRCLSDELGRGEEIQELNPSQGVSNSVILTAEGEAGTEMALLFFSYGT